MRKVVVVLSALVLVFSFGACGPEGSLSSNEAKRVVVNDIAGDTEIDVPIDSVLVFEHYVNITTGQGVKLLDGGNVFRQVASEYIPESDLLGAPGKLLSYVTATTSGHAKLEFGVTDSGGRVQDTKSYYAYSHGAFSGKITRPAEQAADVVQYEPPSTYAPASFDWCSQGVCPAVRNQGSCGSCWAFGTVGPLEINIARAGGSAPDLSEQYLVSCNNEGYGCNGGWWVHEYHLANGKKVSGETESGAVLETTRPYTGTDAACNPPHAKAYKGKSSGTVGQAHTVPSANALKEAIYTNGPLSVAVYADSTFQSYKGGIFKNTNSTANVNHAVTLVGYDGNVFKLRNSWGSNWGESGYMRIEYGANKIGYNAQYIIYEGGGPTPTPTPTPGPTPTPTPGPTPTPAPTDSCEGKCGQKSGSCWCDTNCKQYGDCCADYDKFCGNNPTPTPQPTPDPTPTPTPQPTPAPGKSCINPSGGDYCGKKSADGCWCDSYCEMYSDCCPDKKQVCK